MSDQGTIVISDSDSTVVIEGDDDTSDVDSVNGRTGTVTGLAEQPDLDAEIVARIDGDADLQTQFDAFVAGGGTGDLLSTNNLSDLTDPAAARDNLGLGDIAVRTASEFATAADLTAEEGARITRDDELQADIDALIVGGGGDMLSTNNLSELTDPAAARANLELGSAALEDTTAFVSPTDLSAVTDALGTAAFRDVGTASGNVAEWTEVQAAIEAIPTVAVDSINVPDDPGDKADFVTQDTGGGVMVTFLRAGNLATLDDIIAGTGDMLAANNLSDVADVATSRTNLGLGTAAVEDASAFDPAGTAAALTAADIPFTPAGTIAASTVQAAIEEAASEAGTGTSFSDDYVPDIPAPLQATTTGTTVGSTGATNVGYRDALLSLIDKATTAGDTAVVSVEQVQQGFVVTDGVITGTTNLSSATGGFTSDMTGHIARAPGIIPAGTTVTFIDANNLTLSAASTNTTGLLVDINPLLKTTGLVVRSYTPRDNGGDTSAILGVQTGGGGAVTGYKTAGRRPSGFTDYSLSPQGAAEFGTDGGSQAILGIAGTTIFGVSGFRSAGAYIRIDNSVSDGIVIAPNDATFDGRYAWVVGNKNINAAPSAIKSSLTLAGDLTVKSIALTDLITQAQVENLVDDLAAKATTAALSAHEADTTSIHGIADTSLLETTAGAQAKVDAHVNDTTDAHDASAISILDTANDFTATDVEGALAELQSDHEADATALADHLADTADAHDASAISILDTAGNFTLTDVEGALVELADSLTVVDSFFDSGVDIADIELLPAQITGLLRSVDTERVQGFDAPITDDFPNWVVGRIAGLLPNVGVYFGPGNGAMDVAFQRTGVGTAELGGDITLKGNIRVTSQFGADARGRVSIPLPDVGNQSIRGFDTLADTLPNWMIGRSTLYPNVGVYLAGANGNADVTFMRTGAGTAQLGADLTVNGSIRVTSYLGADTRGRVNIPLPDVGAQSIQGFNAIADTVPNWLVGRDASHTNVGLYLGPNNGSTDVSFVRTGTASATIAGAVTSTGAAITLGDGTASHGGVKLLGLLAGVNVAQVNLFNNLDDANPMAALTVTNGVPAWTLGPGGADATDVRVTRTGTGTATVLGTWTIPAPVITGHPTIEGVTPTGATGTGLLVFGSAPALTSPTGLGVPRVAVVANDVTHAQSSTTLSDVTGLLIAIAASSTEVWFFEAYLMMSNTGTASDAKFGWTVPASCTMQWGAMSTPATNMSSFGPGTPTQSPNALTAAGGTVSVGSINGTFGVSLAGYIFAGGTGGNVQLQFAQNTSDASDLKVLKSSILRFTKVTS